MKIGIITFWNSQDNYGQLLQCYALQYHLKKLGHNPFLIRYVPLKKQKSIFEWICSLWKIFSIKYLRAYLKYKKQNQFINSFNINHSRNFDDFRKQYIISSPLIYYSFAELWKENWDADAFICGSDQIWSYSKVENLKVNFLDFVPINIKRIAYAASFGREQLPLYYKIKLPSLLKRFTSIGLRESSGVELCRRAFREDSTLVCDPTLLLLGKDYISNIVKGKIIIESSAFCYLLNWETEFPIDEVKDYISKRKLNMNFISSHVENEQQLLFDQLQDLSISAWLYAIASAQCVFTNSYHGTIFSILFKKPFVVFPLKGISIGMNDRLITLLAILGLESRIYSSDNSLASIIDKDIDWDKIDQCLNDFRIVSDKFLHEALKQDQTNLKKGYNICFQTHSEVNHDYGGLDRVTEILSDYFERQGATVYYLSQIRRTNTNNCRQYYLPNSKKLKSSENIYFYNQFLDEKKIDVLINQEGNVDIHIPYNNNHSIIFLTTLHFSPNYILDDHFVRKFKNIPIFPFVRNSIIQIFKIHCVKKNAFFYLNRKLARNYKYQSENCDSYILLSNRFRRDLKLFFKETELPNNIVAINNPAFIPKYEFDASKKKKKLLYVGRLECGMKRLDVLLDMWEQISFQFPEWSLHLVGSGPDEQSLKHQVKKFNIPRVLFEGVQNPYPYYDESSIFCFSAGSEGWGMVLVEAQSMGCVPIAFNSYSSIMDIIEDGKNGILIESNNNDLYKDRLMMLMMNEELRNSMAQEAIRTVKRFDINNIGQQWFQLINTIKNQKS